MLDYIKWFWKLWRKVKGRMAGILLLTVISITVKTFSPVFLKVIIDKLTSHAEPLGLKRLILYFLGFTVLQEFISHALPYCRAFMNSLFAATVRNRYFEIITKRSLSFMKRFRTGDLLTRLTDDIDGSWDRIAWYSCSGIFRPIEAILVLAFTLGVMFYYSWQLTLYTFIPLPFLVLILSLSEHKMVKYTDIKQKSITDCNNVLEACFAGIRVIKTTLSEKNQIEKYEEALADRVKKEKQFLRLNQVIQLFSTLVNQTGTIIVIFVGSLYVVEGKISLGAFFMFFSFLQNMIEPIWTISWFYASSKQVFKYVDRLKEVEKEQEAAVIEKENPGEFSSLSFRDVHFRYEDAFSETLQGINFSLKKGQKLAVIGTVGAGKTSLLELIAGNLVPTEGEILFNNSPLSTVEDSILHGTLGYVRQENILFSETIKDNIYLGDEFPTDKMEMSLETALMNKEIAAFPKGLHTVLGQRGLSLSGGQKQRVSLARTLIREPKLILLDDVTAAMDAKTEGLFWEKLQENFPGITAIIVTHRLATAKNADKIIVLAQGKIMEEGSHEILWEKDGLYRKIMSHSDHH